ncbi:lysophospholipid acyltransferase family protein [Lipingzhangella sp. LS1_29]|uniref:Lysophospholipid acyltransferase family protein n=1 Tax=Lipingzhangella rawalii TaxID=2055835 RepID=A0ABU2H1J3_9ACTN|nr:lysophospholipid acyltransferase family protein [Lipingzhangella rawalii]MDS1269168.1 lysophospholipid acyltransferase family protein [Lipingzhangella rawalii]
MSLYSAAKVVVKPTTQLLWQPRVEGVHHVPRQGPVILASNHLSLLDPLFIGVAAPRECIFVAKQELFAGSTLPRRTVTTVLRALGQLPVDRRPGAGARAAMDSSLNVLNDRRVLVVFPEGSRSPDGRLHRGHTGLAWLALTAQAPVVPVALAATQHILPDGRFVPRLNRVGVRFGPAVDLSAWAGQAGRARARREATDTIMTAIQRLSNQEQVPRYAASVKAEVEAGAATSG